MEGKSGAGERITAALFLLFSFLYLFKAVGLPVGVPRDPGPGLIPVVIGALLASCTGYNLVRVFRKAGKGPDSAVPGSPRNYAAILGMTACAVLYPVLLGGLKYLATTFLVSLFMLLLLNPKKRFFALFLAAGMSLFSFLIFSRFLGVALPMGFLEVFFLHVGG
ncbi:MAG TPA: tripartite tricarboxylate transporter TctB family protein [Thermodesulfobacteriota bacterium]|nr:tripartite tricarboxylate transporter TctB family protein [Thermodesulfobacteriota bacterium]